MARFCGNCGRAVEDATVFCGGCGARMAAAATPPVIQPPAAPAPQWQTPQTPIPPPFASPPAPQYGNPQPPRTVPPPPPPPQYGAPQVQYATRPQFGAPPPPQYIAQTPPYGASPRYGAPSPYGAQPQYGGPPQGDIAAQISAKSGAVLGALNLQNAQGTGNIIAMMIRAAMLDGQVARAAAADANGNGKALTAILLSMSIPTVVAIIFGSSYMTTAVGLAMTFATLAIGIAMTFVSLGLMSACSQAIVGRKLSFGEIFRGLSYAQSPALLGFIPVVGMIAGLWRLPTTLVALRDMAPTTMGKAFGLLLVGALASVVLSLMLMPILLGLIGSSFARP